MGLVTKLMNNVLGNLAAGAVSSLMEADNKAADARKAEAQAKMQAYELQKKQMEEDARRRKKKCQEDRKNNRTAPCAVRFPAAGR